MTKSTKEPFSDRLDRAYLDLVECGFPKKFVPSTDLRERPVTSAMLRDVPLFTSEEYGVTAGEEIPAASQVEIFYQDCKKGFSGVAVFAGIRHPYPARYAAFAYAAERVARGKLDPRLTAWRTIEYGFGDNWLDNSRDDTFQPDLLIIDAMYRECNVQRIEKIRAYVELGARSTIIIAAGLSPVEAAFRRLNVEYGRVLFFL